MPGCDGRAGTAGFSLLETLVALAILALALSALFQSFSGGLRAVDRIDHAAQARALAQSLLSEDAGDRARRPVARAGALGDFTWRLEVSQTEPELAGLPEKSRWALYRVSVAVSWPGGGPTRLETLRLGPRS